MIDEQIRFEDISEDYKAFVEKFKPKKTTDDCYTPEPVFNAIADYVEQRYKIAKSRFVRPFWPGGDYLRFDYPQNCIVVDNPPFSIISQIVRTYNKNGIDYFLFCPYLTCMGIRGCTKIICDAEITYENGAVVNTCFVTNQEPGIIARSDPELRKLIKKVNKESKPAKQKPKYEYPPYVVTATMFGYLSKYGQHYELKEKDGFFIRSLSSQRSVGKAIFGNGYLISEKAAAEKAAAEKAAAEKAAAEKAAAEKAAAEKAAAEKWHLSDEEMKIIKSLGE